MANDVCRVATPFTKLAVPSWVAPVANETVPVGLAPLTLAFNVICPFTSPAVGEACRVVVLAAGVMLTAAAGEVLAVLSISPE